MIRRLDSFQRLGPRPRPGRTLGHAAAIAATLTWMSGCERPAPAGGNPGHPRPTLAESSIANPVSLSDEDRTAAARQRLRSVIARYRAAKSYRDRGVVQMTYRTADNVHHDSAPLSVHFVAPSLLLMEAYSTRLEWRDGTLRAFVDSPEVNRMDRQLLQRRFKDPRIEAVKLYRDPIFSHFAAAGPGGPAPQIELLFGENPLAGFFADEMRLEIIDEGVTDGRPCQRLLIEAEGSRYVLWVDRDEAIIRKIELPSIELPQMPADPAKPGNDGEGPQPPAEVALSIDFIDAEINGSSEPLADQMPQSGVLTVETLTLSPPPLASPLLGRRSEPFQLPFRMTQTADETAVVTERGSDREHTILLWVAGHSGSVLAMGQLAAFADSLPSEVRRRTRFVVVQAEPLGDIARLQATHQGSLGWANDQEAIGRDRFGIEQAPALCALDARGIVHWLQSPVGPEMTATLDGLLRDLSAGIDVGAMLREQYEANLDVYEKLLKDRVVD